ncbi:related to ubiquitin-specific protease 7 [Cephalotrichum gorgonifer]|uniref:Ubiquitin carboxyl-terminal hydrolase n=1 Tax=Cephalotrichum gorgonifer TaxID=2041049 RepID=A0AAE8SXC6_9PEZI|nr:related to ubiquitin-specific protease 7 [Cephalotrichum gorgonifer]
MASIPVVVKHQGKKYDVEVDTSSPGEVFKFQLFSLTGVEPDRQKILVKGGQLKDDTDMSKLGLKPKQVLMMLGTPSGAGDLVRPTEPVKFIEDMTEAEAAQQQGATPAGLVNLGNTCYLNSTLQTLRAIPELQDALVKYQPDTSTGRRFGTDVVADLRNLYKRMGETQESPEPIIFLNTLRNVFPQFAERSQSTGGYAQQDAEEAWSQIVGQLRSNLKIVDANNDSVPFIDRYMTGRFSNVLKCDEETGEEPVSSEENFLKLNCHITGTTNHLTDGIANSLTEKIEKNSEALGRETTFTKTSQISRLPKYLTVHFVRFFWRRDTQKKAKIMRKVTFPKELDLVEFCTDDLKKMLIPIRDKVREIRKDEEDVERSRKRRKVRDAADVAGGFGEPTGPTGRKKQREEEEKRKREEEEEEKKRKKRAADGDVEMQETYKTDAEIEAEKDAALLQAKKELSSLVSDDLRSDEGANQSGLYDLRAVITHQGSSADSGHYTAYVKKTAPVDPKTGKKGQEDGNWWWFNDDKISEVPGDKIETLAGGGETHSALILLYKAIDLPVAEAAE